jgi:hypothetical protein
MYHRISEIGQRYQELSELRKEKNIFKADIFFDFAKQNINKYSIVEKGDDLLVSTWYSDKLIDDFQKTLK